MFKNRLSRSKKLALHRAVPLTALAAVMATAITVTPSIAGSVLSPAKAKQTYLTRKDASKLYLRAKTADRLYVPTKGSHKEFLTNKTAKKNYLTSKVAKKDYLTNKAATATYVSKAELPPQPVGFIASSSVDFGPVQSTTPVPVPSSAIAFDVPVTSVVTLQFSGQATCTASAADVGCPIQLLIDEQPTGEVRSNFSLSSTGTPAPLANTLTTTTVLTEGPHIASVQYAGSNNATLNFGLRDWSFTVQAFPDLG